MLRRTETTGNPSSKRQFGLVSLPIIKAHAIALKTIRNGASEHRCRIKSTGQQNDGFFLIRHQACPPKALYAIEFASEHSDRRPTPSLQGPKVQGLRKRARIRRHQPVRSIEGYRF